ncbi:MAG TPA: helix-turn-helix transcriptional regulator [Streptosporangiaceae bacterium]|nr:helix-turn-helix transcriptional regulator [Streptosporangiaceae bacterium]
MSGSTRRDPGPLTRPAGGAGGSGRHDKALVARQAGRRLAAERRSLGITQAQLAQAMGVTPGRVSQIERGGPATIDATARYITALGGELDLVATLGGPPVIIATTAGRDQGRESATDADHPGSGASRPARSPVG